MKNLKRDHWEVLLNEDQPDTGEKSMVSNQNNTEIILYTTPEGNIKIDTVFQNETIWLTQKKMAELFDVNVPAISKHLSNIYDDGELKRKAT